MPEPEDDEKTRIIRRPAAEPDPAAETIDEGLTTATRMLQPTAEETEMTRLVGPPRRSAKSDSSGAVEGGESDPVVGWLVVVAGPGRGQARRLGYGQNSVGRDKSERVALDFGDAGISRSKHCFILYDPRKRQFLLRSGDGTNLTYLNGDVLAEARILAAGNTIEVGDTKLRFVPLCGPDFDWQDETHPPK
jgi:hypothetical protein